MSQRLKELQLSSSVATEEDIAALQHDLGEKAETRHVHVFSEIRLARWDDSETLETVLESKQQSPDAYETTYGLEAQALGNCATALGACAEADAGGVAVGFNAKACSMGVAIGAATKVSSNGSVVIGANACDDDGLSPIVIGGAYSATQLIVRSNGELVVAGQSMATFRCVDDLYRSYDNFTSTTNGEIAGLCSAVNTHETKLRTACSCFAEVDRELQAVDACFTAVKAQASSLKAAVCKVEQAQSNTGLCVTDLQTQVDEAKSDTTALGVRVATLERLTPTYTVTVDTALSETSTNPVQNKVVTEALNNKQGKLTAGDNITITEDGTISATGGGTGDLSAYATKAELQAETSRASNIEQALNSSISSLRTTVSGKQDAPTVTAHVVTNLGDVNVDVPNEVINVSGIDQASNLYYQKCTLAEMGFTGEEGFAPKTISLFRRANQTTNGSTNMWLRILRHDGTSWYVAYQATQHVTHNSYNENGQRILHTMAHKNGSVYIPKDEQVIICYASSETAPAHSLIAFACKLMPSTPTRVSTNSTLPAVDGSPTFSNVCLALHATYETSKYYREIEDKVVRAFVIDEEVTSTSSNPVQSKAVYNALTALVSTISELQAQVANLTEITQV